MLGLTLGRCFSRNAIQSKHYMYDARPIALSSLSYRRHFSESLIPETWRNGIQRRLFSSTHVPYADKNSLPTPPKLHSLENSEDTKTAREWVERWKALRPEDDIPRSVVEVTFAKSTGPGGQNVNKVATKASMRLSLGSKWWIPQWSLPFIQADTHYVASSNSLLITSHRTRSQAENLDDCFRKLHNIILTAASKPIKNEPSESQKKRVELLERADKARRRQSKSYRSGVKKYRGSKGVSID